MMLDDLPRGERYEELTPREVEVLALLALGKGCAAIMATLCLSKRGVECHLENLRAKALAGSTLEALAHYCTITVKEPYQAARPKIMDTPRRAVRRPVCHWDNRKRKKSP